MAGNATWKTSALLGAIFLVACARDNVPVNFYLLTATAPQAVALRDDGPRWGLGPVRIANYLNRPQLITAQSGVRYQLWEHHHWAERLDQNIARVVGENLIRLTGFQAMLPHPWAYRDEPDYQISIEIESFHIDDAQHCLLTAVWQLKRLGTPPKRLEQRRFYYREPVPAQDAETLVAAQNQALLRLAETIAARMREWQASPGAP